MLAIAIVYQRIVTLAGVSQALNGQSAAAVGVVAFALWRQGRNHLPNLVTAAVAAAVFAGSAFWHLNPALLVVAAGLLGVVTEIRQERRQACNNVTAKSP
jgi:chromate transport protein ChrA